MIREIEKWEGLGNDFVVIDARENAALTALAENERSERFRALCDRHRGIGADGVLLLVRTPSALAKMLVYNADGGRPEMCGNGLRCMAAYLVSHGAATQLDLDTEAGVKRCDITVSDHAYCIRVDMGPARDVGERSALGHVLREINIGNPHAILFDPPAPGPERDALAKQLEFIREGNTNVEFARVAQNAIDLVVWERGVGYTQACGTGACATVFAACLEGRLAFNTPTIVHLPGGDLKIVAAPNGDVEMSGPARRVFRAVVG